MSSKGFFCQNKAQKDHHRSHQQDFIARDVAFLFEEESIDGFFKFIQTREFLLVIQKNHIRLLAADFRAFTVFPGSDKDIRFRIDIFHGAIGQIIGERAT